MSNGGRSQFVWPEPGLPRLEGDEEAFAKLAPGPNVSLCGLGVGGQRLGGGKEGGVRGR